MKKTIFIILPMLALGLLLSGCGQKATQTAEGDSVESFAGSIEDLINRGKNSRCELSAKVGDQISKGTNYVSGNKVRSDYEINFGDQLWHSHAITDKEWMYSWIDEMPGQATKIKISDMEKYQGETTEEGNAAMDNYGIDYDYKCYSWSPDSSKFDPPSNVNFMDMTTLINQMGITDEKKAGMDQNCAVCDMIADEATRNTCRQSLNCQ